MMASNDFGHPMNFFSSESLSYLAKWAEFKNWHDLQKLNLPGISGSIQRINNYKPWRMKPELKRLDFGRTRILFRPGIGGGDWEDRQTHLLKQDHMVISAKFMRQSCEKLMMKLQYYRKMLPKPDCFFLSQESMDKLFCHPPKQLAFHNVRNRTL